MAKALINKNTVALDVGSHFFGSGLAFPVFKGDASSSLFAEAGYTGFGLTYRDFSAGVSASEPTGGSFLAEYLAKVAAKKPSLLPAVATNLNITGDTHLTADQVAPYKIISLADGRR